MLRYLLALLFGRPQTRVRFRFWLGKGKQSFIEGEHLMSRLTTEQRALLSVIALTAAGHPARIDGRISFASSDPSVASIVQVDDVSAYVYANAPGVTQITAEFDADLGAGVRLITGSTALEVVEAEAAGVQIQIGPAELGEQPTGEGTGSTPGDTPDDESTGGNDGPVEPDAT